MSNPFVQSKLLCWKVFSDAKAYNCRPSDLLGITNDYVAYCFDTAVSSWGSHVMGELHDQAHKGEKGYVKSKAEQTRLLERLLDIPVEQRSFRTPTATR